MDEFSRKQKQDYRDDNIDWFDFRDSSDSPDNHDYSSGLGYEDYDEEFPSLSVKYDTTQYQKHIHSLHPVPITTRKKDESTKTKSQKDFQSQGAAKTSTEDLWNREEFPSLSSPFQPIKPAQRTDTSNVWFRDRNKPVSKSEYQKETSESRPRRPEVEPYKERDRYSKSSSIKEECTYSSNRKMNDRGHPYLKDKKYTHGGRDNSNTADDKAQDHSLLLDAGNLRENTKLTNDRNIRDYFKSAMIAKKDHTTEDQAVKIQKLNKFLTGMLSSQIGARVPADSDCAKKSQITSIGTLEKTNGDDGRNVVEEINQMIQGLTIDPVDDDLVRIQTTAESIRSASELKELATSVYNHCLKDREFGKAGASLCVKLENIEVAGSKFRTVLLSLLQVDYKDKDSIRQNNPGKFLGFVTFLCQIFGNLRIKGQPITVLNTPIYDCINLIIEDDNSTDDEYESLLLQLQSIGKDLEDLDENLMSEFMRKTRTKLIKGRLSARSRCSLLELFESYSRGWKTLPNEITRYYCDTMAEIFTDAID